MSPSFLQHDTTHQKRNNIPFCLWSSDNQFIVKPQTKAKIHSATSLLNRHSWSVDGLSIRHYYGFMDLGSMVLEIYNEYILI